MNELGLKERYLNYIEQAVKFFPSIEKAVIFGSRAMGNYKPGSNIDLAIFGKNITRQNLLDLRGILSEGLPIPYFFDIVHFEKINNHELKNHITNQGICIYKNPQPLVSVLMTVYNREKYITEAIESVLASSYKKFELIIVDDQSTDKSVEIARKYEAIDGRIKVYVNEKNLGDYPNRNKAASYAKGKYIKYLDADDKIYWYGLEEMIRAMEKHPEAAIALSHSKTEELVPYPYLVTPEQAYREHFLGRGLFNYGPTGLIFRKDIFDLENGFKKDQFISDTEFLLRVGAKYPTVKMAPGLIWWRQHEEQQINIENEDENIFIIRYKLNLLFLNEKNCPLSIIDKQKAIRRLKQHHARKILSMFLKRKKWSAYKVYRKSNLKFYYLLLGFKRYS